MYLDSIAHIRVAVVVTIFSVIGDEEEKTIPRGWSLYKKHKKLKRNDYSPMVVDFVVTADVKSARDNVALEWVTTGGIFIGTVVVTTTMVVSLSVSQKSLNDILGSLGMPLTAVSLFPTKAVWAIVSR